MSGLLVCSGIGVVIKKFLNRGKGNHHGFADHSNGTAGAWILGLPTRQTYRQQKGISRGSSSRTLPTQMNDARDTQMMA